MFCPRCGRPVNTEANFCGGCGLSKVEIEKYLTKTAPVQEVPQQEVPQPETVVAEVVEEKIPQAEQPCEAPESHVFWESEAVKAEDKIIDETIREEPAKSGEPSPADNNCTYAYSYKKAENTETKTTQESTAATAEAPADAAFTAAPTEVKLEAPLTTVDFIWMLVLSALPVIGLIYIIYLAVQNNNTNKRSFARATLIVGLFAFLLTFVFAIGMIIAGLF